jgi:hypothetical protein
MSSLEFSSCSGVVRRVSRAQLRVKPRTRTRVSSTSSARFSPRLGEQLSRQLLLFRRVRHTDNAVKAHGARRAPPATARATQTLLLPAALRKARFPRGLGRGAGEDW